MRINYHLNGGVKIVEYDRDSETVTPGRTFDKALLLLKLSYVTYENVE